MVTDRTPPRSLSEDRGKLSLSKDGVPASGISFGSQWDRCPERQPGSSFLVPGLGIVPLSCLGLQSVLCAKATGEAETLPRGGTLLSCEEAKDVDPESLLHRGLEVGPAVGAAFSRHVVLYL